MILSLDPGVRALGFAIFAGRTLARAGASILRKPPERLEEIAALHADAIAARVERAIVESMRWRPNDARSQPNDLLDVQTVGILTAHRLSVEIALVRAADWKNNLPKQIHHARLERALTAAERVLVTRACDVAGAHAKEVLDAVGIGLEALGRIDRAGRVVE